MKNIETIKEYINENNYFDLDAFIKKYYGYVYMIVKNYKGINISDEDIEEIVSDVFLAIWKARNNIKTDISITSYLVGIIRNLVKNKFRNIKSNYFTNDYDDEIIDSLNLETLLEEREKDNIIQNTLQTLPTTEYDAFIMFYYASKKIKDIAETLHISENHVKVALYRVRKKIKKNLKKGGYDFE